MNLDKLTLKSQELFQKAHTIAVEKGQQAIEPIHFLGALLADDQGIAVSIFNKIGADPGAAVQRVSSALDNMVKVSGGQP